MNLTVIILIIAGMFIQGCFMYAEYKKKWTLAVILKGSASLFFVAVGIICSIKAGFNSYNKLIITGLCCGLLGDVLLNLRHVFKEFGDKIFLVGIAAFFAGHIVYLIAVIPYANKLIIDTGIGIIISALLLKYIFTIMKVKPAFKAFGVFYLGAIIIMTCMAVDAAIFVPSTKNFIFAFGAMLFTASDIVLIFNTFNGKETLNRRIANLSLYYIGQMCIAMTTMFFI